MKIQDLINMRENAFHWLIDNEDKYVLKKIETSDKCETCDDTGIDPREDSTCACDCKIGKAFQVYFEKNA